MINEFVPYLSITNANDAIDFYSHVFGQAPTTLIRMPDGRVMHCEFRFGNHRIYCSEELPEHGGTPSPTRMNATTVSIHIYVDNCDEMVERMHSKGAEVLSEPEDLFWGERFARVKDPFGHEWGIAQRVSDMTPTEIEAAAKQMFDSFLNG